MKPWLKTGLIITGIVGVLWVISLILSFSLCEGESCMLAGGILGFGIPSMVIVFVLACIFGALANKVSTSEGTSFSKALKMGLWVGLIGAVTYLIGESLVFTSYFLNISNIKYLFSQIVFHGGLFYMVIVFVLGFIVGGLIYWIIQKVRGN